MKTLLLAILYCGYVFTLTAAKALEHPRELTHIMDSVEEKSPSCQLSRSMLFCDYKWKQGTARMDRTNVESYDTIYIQKLDHLVLDRSICLSLILKHISKVTVEGEAEEDCLGMRLSFQNVTLDFIEDSVSSVYADESHIKELTLSKPDSKMTVIGSKVDILNIPTITGEDTSLKIHSSRIHDFQQLHISGAGVFHIQDSIVENFPSNSLVLNGSRKNLISGVEFTNFDEDSLASVVLSNGAELTIEDIKGTFKVYSPSCVKEMDSHSPAAHPNPQLITQANDLNDMYNVYASKLIVTSPFPDDVETKTLEEINPKLLISVVVLAITNCVSLLIILLFCFITFKDKIWTPKSKHSEEIVKSPLTAKGSFEPLLANQTKVTHVDYDTIKNMKILRNMKGINRSPKTRQRTLSYPAVRNQFRDLTNNL